MPVSDAGALLAGLFRWTGSGKDPWLAHAVERELASAGIGRTMYSLRRFALVAPHLSAQPMPVGAVPYIREVVAQRRLRMPLLAGRGLAETIVTTCSESSIQQVVAMHSFTSLRSAKQPP